MENTKIKCTINDISNLKDIIEKNSLEILDCLKKIDKDYEEMPDILNTPNSSKIVPKFVDYVKKKEKYITESNNYYKKVFDTIITEYNEFMTDTKEKVGGDN